MQNVFKRYEEKYLVSKERGAELREIISRRMEKDTFGEYLVQNLYFDTANRDVIRCSLEKPLYKEKMRLRCYDIPDKESRVFLELKKKYDGIVYKRRIAIPYSALTFRSVQSVVAEETSQVARELDFYMKTNNVFESVYIAYRRTAFASAECDGLRVTFDTDIRFRTERLDYLHPDCGNTALARDKIVMEIKTPGGMPLWMSRLLSEKNIFPASFSKYGVCYSGCIAKRRETETKEKLSA